MGGKGSGNKAGRAAKAKSKAAKATTLEQGGILPLFKKPMDKVGWSIYFLGSFWGSAGRAGEENKEFKCTLTDFSIAYVPAKDEVKCGLIKNRKCSAFKMTEMGVDGNGGDSHPFWVSYPCPFLEHFYRSHPDELKANKTNHPAHGETSAAAAAAGTPDEEAPFDEASNPKVYDNLELVRCEMVKGRTRTTYTCGVVMTDGPRIGQKCGGSVTLYGKTTSNFFTHCRRRAKNQHCAAHAALVEMLNDSSCRQVQLEDGTYVSVHTFAESFAHHCDFVWLVATGMSMRMNRNDDFKAYVTGFEARAVLPSNDSVHRIATCIEEVQLAHMSRDRRVVLDRMASQTGALPPPPPLHPPPPPPPTTHLPRIQHVCPHFSAVCLARPAWDGTAA